MMNQSAASGFNVS
jgi:hypothetical protein